MAQFSILRYSITLIFTFLYFVTLNSQSISSFEFKNFGNSSIFESQVELHGDALVINGSSFVQITGSKAYSYGSVVYRKPIKFVEGNPRKNVSFSMEISFSMSLKNVGNLAFILMPNGFNYSVFGENSFGFSYGLNESKNRVLMVEFNSKLNEKTGDLNANHIVYAKVRNISSISVAWNGEKLSSWIDYDAGSKRLEVRLSNFGDLRPLEPILDYPIDFSGMWNEEDVFMGLSSSSDNSTTSSVIYSWGFKLRRIPHWMHSEPLDPIAYSEKTKSLTYNKSDCLFRLISLVIFGTVCGALGGFIVLFLWTFFCDKRPIVPEEFVVHPVEFESQNIKIVLCKAVEDVKK